MTGSQEHRFAVGETVAGRYRILRLLGQGGMGRVYKADDRVLKKFVALKVPSPASQPLLRGEVRMAHQVAHPNVCRVYDLVEAEGVQFLSMELIDGESLSKALERSLGTLSLNEKLRIAHEVCDGLTAIHEQSIVHRDLKPANIMIDRDHRTLIADFGLAEQASAVTDPRSGTLLYKAPEQLSGGRVGVASDLYALGVVLYELFVGKHPFQREPRETLTEDQLRNYQQGEIQVILEEAEDQRVPELAGMIARCLEWEPEKRPASAREVAGALGSRLLVFPDTPAPVYRLLLSPEGGGLSRSVAWSCLAATVGGLLLVTWLAADTEPMRATIRGDPPEVLEARARDHLAALGFEAPPGDRRRGFVYSATPDAAAQLTFWYRQSPRRLMPLQTGNAFHRPDDPPLAVPGEVRVYLDPRGRLLHLDAVPEAQGPIPGSPGAPDWRPLMTAAGLDLDDFRSIETDWIPPVFADHRAAWEAIPRTPAATPPRLEAAAVGGRPVAFRRIETGAPTLGAPETAEDALRVNSRTGRHAAALWFGAVLIVAIFASRRSLRMRTADRAAAFRLAIFVLLARILVGILGEHHIPGPSELNIALGVFSRALVDAALIWIIYIGLEPVVRRFSPVRAASWVRLVYGRVRDPRVGRDLLVGGLFGLAALLWAHLYAAASTWLGLPPPQPDQLSPLLWMIGQRHPDLVSESLGGLREALAMASYGLVHAVLVAFLAVLGVMILRRAMEIILHLTHRKFVPEASVGDTPDPHWWWISRAAAFVLFLILTFPAAGPFWLDLLAAAGASLLWLVALVRFGFLTAVTATVFTWLLGGSPATLNLTTWPGPGAAAALVLTLGISLWGFRMSIQADKTGVRTLFPPAMLDRFI